jgi:hypothetical protein
VSARYTTVTAHNVIRAVCVDFDSYQFLPIPSPDSFRVVPSGNYRVVARIKMPSTAASPSSALYGQMREANSTRSRLLIVNPNLTAPSSLQRLVIRTISTHETSSNSLFAPIWSRFLPTREQPDALIQARGSSGLGRRSSEPEHTALSRRCGK